MPYTPSPREVLVALWRPVAEQVERNPTYAALIRGQPVVIGRESLRVLEGGRPSIPPGHFDAAPWWVLSGAQTFTPAEEPV